MARLVDEMEASAGDSVRDMHACAAGPEGSLLVHTTSAGQRIARSSSSVTMFRRRTAGSCRHIMCRIDSAKCDWL